MNLNTDAFFWKNPPTEMTVEKDRVSFVTLPLSDFWQNTYYHFQHDNGHMYLTRSDEPYFAFSTKISFDGKLRFDQCGIIVYQDADTWAKSGIECENEVYSNLGGVVTNNGFSDWSMSPIKPEVKDLYLRLNRRVDDFQVEYSYDGVLYQPLRIFHLESADKVVQFGLYACSPGESSFTAQFSEVSMGEGTWAAHE